MKCFVVGFCTRSLSVLLIVLSILSSLSWVIGTGFFGSSFQDQRKFISSDQSDQSVKLMPDAELLYTKCLVCVGH